MVRKRNSWRKKEESAHSLSFLLLTLYLGDQREGDAGWVLSIAYHNTPQAISSHEAVAQMAFVCYCLSRTWFSSLQ